MVLAWGYFLYQGVRDPLGGINSLWPLFGIANQLLAAIALCVATTILLKMHGAKYMWITSRAAGMAGGGVLHRRISEDLLARCRRSGSWRRPTSWTRGCGPVRSRACWPSQTRTLIFNARLDAALCGLFLVLVATILIDSVRIWAGILRGTRATTVCEAPFVASALRAEEV